MSDTLLIDCAWTKPAPAAVKAAGYVGVLGYISRDPSKDLTAAQARAYRDAGLAVGFVFETTGGRATAGKSAGASDRLYAEQEAHRRGYPTNCPVFYAVDGDYPPSKVLPYFAGIAASHAYPIGVYGAARVIDAVLKAGTATVGWQTEAWSGTTISGGAHLYQRTGHTGAPIVGVKGSAYDENVALRPVRLWGATIAPPASPRRASGFSRTTRAAVVFVTRRCNRRQTPLSPGGHVLLAALIKAAQRLQNLK